MTTSEARLSPRAPVLVFLLLMAVYVLTLCPTVGVGDSGELITAAATLGVPHPTGYPLYILIGKLFITLVPISEVAVRMNLLSALCAATACAIFLQWLRRWALSTGIAVIAALGLGLSLSFWSQANIARVYAPNALLSVLCLYFGLRPVRTFRSRARFFACWGLALANHPVSLFTGLLVLATDWREIRRHVLPALFAIPGLALYAYIPLRARMNPALNVGGVTSWSAFEDYILRSQYWHNRYVTSPEDFLRVMGHYLATIPQEFTWLGAALVPMGLIGLAVDRKFRLLVVGTGLFITNAVAVGLHGSVVDIFHWSRYMIPGYIGIAVVLAFGLDLLGRIGSGAPGVTAALGGSPVSPFSRRASGFARLASMILLPVLLIVSNYVPNDRSKDTLAYAYNYRILAALPPRAVLAPSGDNNVYPILYLQAVEKIRPDVLVYAGYYNRNESVPEVRAPGVFYTDVIYDVPEGFFPRVEGLLFRFLPSPDAPRITRGWEGWRIPEMSSPNLERRDMLTRLLASQYWFFAGMTIPEGRDLLFQRCLDISYDYDGMWMLVAKTYFLYGQWEKARPIAQRAIELNPKNHNAVLLVKAIDDTLRAVAADSSAAGAVRP